MPCKNTMELISFSLSLLSISAAGQGEQLNRGGSMAKPQIEAYKEVNTHENNGDLSPQQVLEKLVCDYIDKLDIDNSTDDLKPDKLKADFLRKSAIFPYFSSICVANLCRISGENKQSQTEAETVSRALAASKEAVQVGQRLVEALTQYYADRSPDWTLDSALELTKYSSMDSVKLWTPGWTSNSPPSKIPDAEPMPDSYRMRFLKISMDNPAIVKETGQLLNRFLKEGQGNKLEEQLEELFQKYEKKDMK